MTPDLFTRLDTDRTIALVAGRAISGREFLHAASALAQSIPAKAPLLNLCNNRYAFALALFAAALRDRPCVLPGSLAAETLRHLQTCHPGLHALHECGTPTHGLPGISVDICADPRTPMQTDRHARPELARHQRAVEVFTSGSTGLPQAHGKHWGKLIDNVLGAAAAHWARVGAPCSVLGTVPAQHMFGLESSVLLPLLGDGILIGERPLFPADIVASLEQMPHPRALVTTPFHLHALLESGLALPHCELIISATAPLPRELAERAEQAMHGIVSEIYGSTETGQVASRRTTQETTWHAFAGIQLREEGDTTWMHGGHIEEAVAMGDVLENTGLDADGNACFILHGRKADLINIAGKRSSITHLNAVLGNLPGVRDCSFFLPDEADHTTEIVRLAAFVVAPGVELADLRRALRERLDAAFMPRPLVAVERLPRNANGKLPRNELEALYRETLRK